MSGTAAARCLGCGKPGGHPGRISMGACPRVARAVVERAKIVAWRWDAWAAGDETALSRDLKPGDVREARALWPKLTRPTPEETPEEHPAPARRTPDVPTRLRWWALGWWDWLRGRLAVWLSRL